jgi:glycosyltransferase involved in cell wall biosynthesis
VAASEHDRSWPALTFVMPVLNERDHVFRALMSVLAQDYPAPFDVVVALGPSTDGTDAIVEFIAADEDRIRIVRVDAASIPVALNTAIAATDATVVARVDAHAVLPPGYVRRAVETLLDQGAANVGGIMVAVGEQPFQRAVAEAYNCRLGLGGGAYHLGDALPGPAESVYLGVMSRPAVNAVGGYDEALGRGEDWELNRRLREAGHKVWLDPALRVTYFPRTSPLALARQFWATGAWRAELVRRFGRANSRRYFAPPALVAVSGIGALAAAGSRLVPHGRSLRPVATGAGAGAVAHLLLVAEAARRRPGSFAHRLRFAEVIVLMHYAWGAGFLKGLLRGARRVEDRSRVRPRRGGVGT